jgi:hypothetical protein
VERVEMKTRRDTMKYAKGPTSRWEKGEVREVRGPRIDCGTSKLGESLREIKTPVILFPLVIARNPASAAKTTCLETVGCESAVSRIISYDQPFTYRKTRGAVVFRGKARYVGTKIRLIG